MRVTSARSAVLRVLAAAVLPAAATAAEPVGFLALAESPVAIRAEGASSFAAAHVDQSVSRGDTLRTGRGGLAKLVLVDDTTVTLDEETELRIDRYVLGGAGGDPSRLRLLSGHVRTRVGETFGGRARLEMHTPVAVLGVKGTEWLTWHIVRTQTTWVCVLSGVLSAAEASGAGATDLVAGECARIRRGAAPERRALPSSLEPVAAARSDVELTPPASDGRQGGEPYKPGDLRDDDDRDIVTGDDPARGLELKRDPRPEPAADPDPDPGGPNRG